MGTMGLKREDAGAGGGIEGAAATIETAIFVDDFNYGNPSMAKQAALFVNFEIDGFDKAWAQNYTLGKAPAYELQDDGYTIKGKLNTSSVAFKFFDAFQKACEDQGLNVDDYLEGSSVKGLNGLRVRLTKVPYETAGGDPKEAIVVGSILTDEPAAKKGRSNGRTGSVAGTGRTNGAAAAPKTVDVSDATEEVIVGLLDTTPVIKKGDLPQLVAAAAKKDPNVKLMTQQCFKESWLGDAERPWEFDRKSGRLKAREDE